MRIPYLADPDRIYGITLDYAPFGLIPILPDRQETTQGERNFYYFYLNDGRKGQPRVAIPANYTDAEGNESELLLDPNQDEIFFLQRDKLAIAKDPKNRNGQREVFLVDIFRSTDPTSFLAPSFVHQIGLGARRKLTSLFEPGNLSGIQRSRLEAEARAPLDQPRDFALAVVKPWSVDSFVSRKTGELEKGWQERKKLLLDPLALKRAILADLPRQIRDTLYFSPDFNLKALFWFVSYYHHLGGDQREVLDENYHLARSHFSSLIKGFMPGQSMRDDHLGGATFIQAFQASDQDSTLPAKVNEMISADPVYGARVLQHYYQLNALEKTFEDGHSRRILELFGLRNDYMRHDYFLRAFQRKVDLKIFKQGLEKRTTLFLKLAAQKEINLQELIKQFEVDQELWGCLLQAIGFKLDLTNLAEDAEELSLLLEGTKVNVFKGGPTMIKNKEEMTNSDNYLNENIFSLKDYHQLVQYIRETYKDHAPTYGEFLIRGIGRDMSDPETTFYTLKNGNTLVGTIKVKPYMKNGKLVPNTYYIGTLYVAPEYRQKFDIGSMLDRFAKANLPPGSRTVAHVSLGNMTSERHFNQEICVGIEVEEEEDLEGKTGDLILMASDGRGQYTSKDLPKLELKRMASGEMSLPKDIYVFKTDSSAENQGEYSLLLRQNFEQGRDLTGVFYGMNEGKRHRQETYVVFETKKAG